MERQIASELDELLVASDEIGLAIDLNEHADPVPGVDVALDHAFAGLLARSLGGLSLAPRPQQLDRLVKIAIGFTERVAAREHDEDAPLIPARYHYFLRSLEGG